MKSVQAKFLTGNTVYSYLVPEGDDPQVNDIIITSIRMSDDKPGRYGDELAKVARIMEVDEWANARATKFYMQLVSVAQVRERTLLNRAFKDRETKRANARAALEAMVARQDRMAEFERLAKDSPTAAALLAVLKDPDTAAPYAPPVQAEPGSGRWDDDSQ